MTILLPWPDVEAALVSLLADLAAVGTVAPADLATKVPFARVECFGGSDNRITDTSRVDVDVFAATRAEAASLAETIRQRLLDTPHVVAGIGTLDWVDTLTRPNSAPWNDPQVRRVTAAYTITCRRPHSA